MKVCKDWYPKGTQKYQKDDGFMIHEGLKNQLDLLVKNVVNDWDFTIIITGSGEVRVGKSVLAMQIAAYWAHEMERVHNIKVKFDLDNFVLDGRKLIQKGNELGQKHPYSPLIFDEAGADLEGRKAMQSVTQDVIDYFRECGQYNMLNILVIPEYFDLPKGIALSRSMFLIDVTYNADENGIFQRGFYYFYSRRRKKQLYLKGKKDLNYNVVPYNFRGRFTNFYPINEQEYRKLKQDALTKRENRKRNKFQIQRDASWFLLSKDGLNCSCGNEVKISQSELGKRMEQLTGIFVAQNTISDGIRHFVIEYD
jgi:hypothetical protein